MGNRKPISWLRSARKDFQRFPKGARERLLQSLELAAEGQTSDIAKPMKGFGSGIFEIALKYRTDAYRTVYAVQLNDAVWVLHCFLKKAKTGIKTPKMEVELVRERLKRLKEML